MKEIMNILLIIIIKFISIKSPCHSSCNGCSNPSISNAITMLCTSCNSNYYPLIKVDLTMNCYLESDVQDGYYFDRNTNTFKSCDPSCKRCYGPIDGDNTNCISCNTVSSYYPIDGSPTFCKKSGDSYLNGYYFDNDYSIFKLCYTSCETCNQKGDSTNNNCLTCKENYFQDGSNCHLECPEDLFLFGTSCVDTCTTVGTTRYYLDLFGKKCTDTCPTGTSKNDALGLCTIDRTSEYSNYDCNYMIENYILDKMDYYISDNSLIVGKNCYIQIYNSLSQNRIHNVADYYKLSKLFLNSDYININIIVVKIDYNQTYNLQPEVNDVKFFLYQKSNLDDNYYQIPNIDLISPLDNDDLIYIEKPFIYTENINSYQEKYKIFDIFNARDQVYNNFCIPFTSEYNTDVTYDFRRQVYFVNLTKYCINDSTIYYSGFNSEAISVQCKANYIENKFAEENVGESRFKVFRCRSYLMNFNNLLKYYGFWVILLIMVFNFSILIPFFMTCFTDIKNFMRIFERGYNKPTGLRLKWTVLNPPKKNVKVIYKPKEFILSNDFFEEEKDLKVKYNLYQNKIKKDANEEETNIGKKKNKVIYESNSNLTSSHNLQSENNNSNSNSNNNSNSNSFNKSESISETEKQKRKMEKERIENEKFQAKLDMKEKKQIEKRLYKSQLMPNPELKSIFKDYSKKQKKILDDQPKNTNLLTLDHIGNVVKNLPTDNLNMKYEPKEYLNQYMFHNFDHLLPVPKSERVSSGSLSSDIMDELLKLAQLREKQMVERIFFKKIIANQKLIKGYNEDFYPFSFDECIMRRKEDVTYKIIFWNYLREINLVVNVLYDENYLESRYLKVYLLGLSFYSMIFFNILFYSDNYINDFYIYKGKFHFGFQITKSIYSSLATFVIVKLMSLLVTSKNKLREIIIKRRYETDKDYIQQYKMVLCILALKIVIFFILLLCFLLFGWFYYCCFSVPYPHSQKFVLVGTIFSLMIYEVFSIAVVALVSGFKYSAIKSQNRQLYTIMSIVNNFL